jgi:hypothetical protein
VPRKPDESGWHSFWLPLAGDRVRTHVDRSHHQLRRAGVQAQRPGAEMTDRDRAGRSAGRLVTLLLGGALTACGSATPPQESPAPAPPLATAPAAPPDVPELVVSDLAIGSGAEAQPGSLVTVHYTGWLYDPEATETKGNKFDSSRDSGKPFQFWLGAGNVIRGWDQGVAGMKVGGQRRLIIPSALGYGERGAGGVIPPGAALVFDVELLEVRAGAG